MLFLLAGLNATFNFLPKNMELTISPRPSLRNKIQIAVVIIIMFALRAALGQAPVEYIVYGIGAMALVVYALRPNIERLRQGTEKRLGIPAALGMTVAHRWPRFAARAHRRGRSRPSPWRAWA